MCSCGRVGHQASYSSAELRCSSCSGAHSADYFRCDAYIFRCEIEATMAREHITRIEATEKVRDTFREEGKSYRFTVHSGPTTEEESTTGGHIQGNVHQRRIQSMDIAI